jgi:hypothetical protein
MVRGLAIIVFSIVPFVPLAVWLYNAQTIAPETAKLFAMPELCRPEPGERLVFLAALIYFPVAIAILNFVWVRTERRGCIRVSENQRWVQSGYAVLLLAVFALSMVGSNGYHLRRNLFYESPVWGLGCFALTIVLLRTQLGSNRWIGRTAYLLAVMLIAAVAGACVFDETHPYVSFQHFAPVLQPVVQVHYGKALLVDARSQYGLYAHLLQPIFAVIGLSITKFTAVMAALMAVSMLGLWSFLRGVVRSQLVALAGFSALVFAGWFFLFYPQYDSSGVADFYFQYYPIRFVFPAAAVWLGWHYFEQPRRWLYALSMMVFSVGVLWNADAGVPALGSWLAALCFAELFEGTWASRTGKIAWHLGAGALSMAAVIAVYAGAIWLRYGTVPDFGQLLAFQELFYVAGFCMLPMPLAGSWNMVVLVYLIGLAYAASALTAGKATVRVKMIFFLTVLGLGLASYYQGRSHDHVLVKVWWPCWALLVLFLDDLLVAVRKPSCGPLARFAAVVTTWLVGGYAWSTVADGHSFLGLLGRPTDQRLLEAAASLDEDVATLRARVPRDAPVVIVSDRDATLYLLSGIAPAMPTSFLEMVMVDDFVRIREFFRQRSDAMLYVQKRALKDAGEPEGNRQLRALLGDFREVGETAGGRLFSTRHRADSDAFH